MKRARLLALALLGFAPMAQAYHPQADQMDRVQSLAKEVEDAARQVNTNADSARSRFDAREERALRRLDDLQLRALHFRRAVEGYRSTPENTQDDFELLLSSYQSASASINDLRDFGNVARDYRAVERAMSQLVDFYGGQEQFWGVRDHDRPGMYTVPSGTPVSVRLEVPLRSRDLENGDEFPTTLESDLVVNGRLIAPRGSRIMGRVKEVDHAGNVKGREHLRLELVQLQSNGRSYPLHTSDITFEAEGSKKRDAGVVGGAAAIGAIIGAITDGDDGAVKGGVAGAAAGTGAVLMTRGKSVRLAAGQQLDFTLLESVRVSPGGSTAPPRDRRNRGRDGDVSHRR